jgi:hypothetical protein
MANIFIQCVLQKGRSQKKSKQDTQNLDIVQRATKINQRIEAKKQTKR